MGDHCINIYYVAQEKNENGIHFSDKGRYEVNTIINAVESILETTMNAFKNDDVQSAKRVVPLSETIDTLKETIKGHHIQRLHTGDCGIPGGIALVDLVTSFERLSSHCSNVALHVIKRVEADDRFDQMGHTKVDFNVTEEYKALYYYYEAQYLTPIIDDSHIEAAIASNNSVIEETLYVKQDLEDVQKKSEKHHHGKSKDTKADDSKSKEKSKKK